MAWFTVQYRGPDGKTESVQIDAADRAGVFAELKKRGITAISVREGATQETSGTSSMRRMLAATIVVVIASVALYLIFKDNAKPETPKEPNKVRAVKELPTPTPRPKPAPEVTEVRPEEPQELPPQKVGETRDGYIKLPNGTLHKVNGVITNTTAAAKGKYAIFAKRSDNEIAALLTIKPGSVVAGPAKFKGRFAKEFLESLKEPIVISPEDSPEDAQLKRSVMDVRKELKEAYDRGEDIEEIMTESRNEFQKLYWLKADLQQEIAKFRRGENVTDEDVDNFVQAANKMLEERGVAPLHIGPIARRRLQLMYQENH